MEDINEFENDVKNFREDISNDSQVPSGYITIELSTKGKLGAPKKFHIKNFTVEQISALNFCEPDQIPIKILKMIPEIVWEKDVDFGQFHEGEVIETLIILYKTFYQSVLVDQNWKLTDEDKEFLKKENGGEDSLEYKKQIQAYDNGSWKPKFDINLDKLEYYDIPDDIKTTVRVTKRNGFTCEFTYPKYGDTLVLHEIITRKFQEKENQYASIKEKIQFRNNMEERWRNGELVDMSRCPIVSEEEKRKYEEFQIEKGTYLTKLTRTILLKSINGQDLSKLPLEEKVKYADDPNLDFSTINKVTKLFKELKVGPVEKIKGYDPIVKGVREIEYSFRVFDFILALQSEGDNEDDIVLV